MSRQRLTEEVLRQVLRAGDPGRDQPSLDATEKAALRVALDRALMGRRVGAPPPFRWAAAAFLIVFGMALLVFLRAPEARPVPSLDESKAPPIATRQLDFRTPGGTRLIWVFDVPDPKEPQ